MNTSRTSIPFARLALAAALAGGAPGLAQAVSCDGPAQTYTVTTANDVTDSEDGVLSLREAIAAAAGNYQCEGSDTIAFDIRNGATINITSSPLYIVSDDVHIDGSTAGSKGVVLTSSITSGNVFAVTYEGGAPNVTLTGITFDGQGVARSGSPLYFNTNTGSITLKDVVVKNVNTTEGSPVSIEYSQPVIIEDSIFTGNSTDGAGGALYFGDSEGTTAVIFTRTTLADNDAYVGGAVYFQGNSIQALFDQSAIVNNTATHAGGGIYNSGATLELVNSTVSGNSATGEGAAPAGFGGGIFQYSSNDIVLNSVTITDNTAASYGGGVSGYEVSIDVTGNASVVAGNSAGVAGTENFNTSGSNVTSLLTNSFTTGDPLLKALALNGGPTPSHMPKSNSPLRDALEAADYSAAPTIDQTGRDRPQGEGYDIGAVEYRNTSDDDGFLGNVGFGVLGLLGLLGLRRRR